MANANSHIIWVDTQPLRRPCKSTLSYFTHGTEKEALELRAQIGRASQLSWKRTGDDPGLRGSLNLKVFKEKATKIACYLASDSETGRKKRAKIEAKRVKARWEKYAAYAADRVEKLSIEDDEWDEMMAPEPLVWEPTFSRPFNGHRRWDSVTEF